MSAGRRLIALVAVAMVAETAAYSAITPLLPELASEHGLSKAAAGLLTAAYPVGTFALALPAAWLCARIGAKRTVLGAVALLALSTFAFGLVTSTVLLIAARLLQGVGAAAIWAGGLAWVAAVAPRARRAEAIGAVLGAAIAGALGGPVIGAAAHELGMAPVFGAFAAVLVAVLLVLVRLGGPPPVGVPTPAELRVAFRDPRMRLGMWLMALPALSFGMFNVLIPLRLNELGAGAVKIGGVFLAVVALESVMSPLAGRLSDRRGAVWPARVGLAGGGAMLVLLPLPGAVLPIALVLVLCAPLLGLLWTPAMAILSDAAEAAGIDLAFGFGLSNLAWGAGAAIGGSGGGALASATTDAVPYLLLAAAVLVTAATLRAPARATVA